MIKKENVTVFQCEYCNKISYSAGGMRLHEISCSKNPINLTPCASCIHCVRYSVIISDEEYHDNGLNINIGDKISRDFIKHFEEQNYWFTEEGGNFVGRKFKHHIETTFTCKIDGSKMYHNKVNRLPKAKAKLIISKCDKQMPTECDNYETDDNI